MRCEDVVAAFYSRLTGDQCREKQGAESKGKQILEVES
jgi:hypothetical protein